jgi:hypothetical protein
MVLQYFSTLLRNALVSGKLFMLALACFCASPGVLSVRHLGAWLDLMEGWTGRVMLLMRQGVGVPWLACAANRVNRLPEVALVPGWPRSSPPCRAFKLHAETD